MSEPAPGRSTHPIFQISTGLMSALFGYSALLQWNDPDPTRWIAIYTCAAVLALVPLFRPILPTTTLALAMVAISWALSLLPGIFVAMDFTGSEEERELGGLALVGAWMLFLFVRSSQERRSSRIAKRGQLDSSDGAADQARKERAQ